ncbi:MAG: hypothetical protein MRY83_10840 [Flavobacteriales bacterium]|nr:hypothetical protein [Flavobacteriales bacterium]
MEQFDFKLNEPELSSEQIRSTMDFDSVLNQSTSGIQKAWYKTWWFWAGLGVCTLAVGLVGFNLLNESTPQANLAVAPKKAPNLNTEAYWESKVDSKTIQLNNDGVVIENGWNITSKNNQEASLLITEEAEKISELTNGQITNGTLLKIDDGKEDQSEVHISKQIEGNEKYHVSVYDKETDKWENSDDRLKIITKEETIETSEAPKNAPAVKRFTTNRVNFQFDFDKTDFPELQPYENIIFQADLAHEGVQEVQWDDITPLKLGANQYQLKLQKFDSILTIDVVPALMAEDYDAQVKETGSNNVHIKKTHSVDATVKTKEWTVISKEEKIVN